MARRYLTVAANPASASLNAMAEFKATLMHVIEAICQVGEGYCAD